ncbi:hypothetical protein MMIC_P1715 [Mariprofundus micogutta]|uniref:Uncharacterized protein n=1 Tax=Mariprofundus micogutta TaxID=1921010 RepID=A0A1L8CP94_9PROT|nr:hypothetical protein [Mariprofundus micogutta]GAV20742.1 hypothetical protein MMIC_P1715 [Mariprofundus micogutta]
MSIESLELAIEEAQTQLDGRESKRLMGWAVISGLLFLVPVVLFFQLSTDTVVGNSYAGVVIVWLMISLGVGNAIAAAMFSGRTVELVLALATASTVLDMEKARLADMRESQAE